jgi:phage-related minor tail protein
LQNAKPNLLQNTNTQTANHRKHSRAKISLQLKTLECGTESNSLGYRKTTKHEGKYRGSHTNHGFKRRKSHKFANKNRTQ